MYRVVFIQTLREFCCINFILTTQYSTLVTVEMIYNRSTIGSLTGLNMGEGGRYILTVINTTVTMNVTTKIKIVEITPR